jgi:hypothetical protein
LKRRSRIIKKITINRTKNIYLQKSGKNYLDL